MGQVLQAGVGQAPARQAALRAGLPDGTSATTINRVCGSGLKSIMLAAAEIRAGDAEIAVAGGMEIDEPGAVPPARGAVRLPAGQQRARRLDRRRRPVVHGRGLPHGHPRRARRDRQPRQPRGPGRVRTRARISGRSPRSTPVASTTSSCPSSSATPRAARRQSKSTRTRGATRPRRRSPASSPRSPCRTARTAATRPTGTVTAGNAPGITDGAAATIVASERAVERLGLKPLARIVGYAQAEVEPKWLFLAPIQGVRRLLDRIELPIEAFDLVEINEAFAAQVLADGRELGFDWDKVNVNGGAIALGHPIGASGARVVATLLHELNRREGRYGLATLCLGGGGSVATAFERVQ